MLKTLRCMRLSFYFQLCRSVRENIFFQIGNLQNQIFFRFIDSTVERLTFAAALTSTLFVNFSIAVLFCGAGLASILRLVTVWGEGNKKQKY